MSSACASRSRHAATAWAIARARGRSVRASLRRAQASSGAVRAGRPRAQLVERLDRPGEPAALDQLGIDVVLEVEQVAHVGGGVLLLVGRQRPVQPVGQPVALGRALPELTADELDQRRRRVADEPGGDLGVVDHPGNAADGVGEHVEVLLGGVQHGDGVGVEQLGEAAPG